MLVLMLMLMQLMQLVLVLVLQKCEVDDEQLKDRSELDAHLKPEARIVSGKKV